MDVLINRRIWGEGIPADIPVFEGFRVMLLAPPAYARGWGAGRHFAGLRPALSIEETLAADAVAGWMARFAGNRR